METYNGHVRTPADAILLFEACRIGLLPRVQRRLSEKERQQIKSGSVFVWDEREAGMRRWTDGKSWSASRVSGSFLTYREMEGKRGGNGYTQPAPAPPKKKSPSGSKDGESDEDGPDGYRYKPDGLMKQSFSITTQSGQHLHLISYYARSHPSSLQQPTQDPQLRHIRPPKNMYPESTVNETSNVPAVTRGPMVGSPYAHAPSPHQVPLGSPYSRPGPAPPGYIAAGNWPPTPTGTPPYQYAYYPPQGPHPAAHSPIHYAYPPHAYAQQPPPGPTVFDRAPPPISNSALPPPPPHMNGVPNGQPPYIAHQPPPQYIPNPPPRAAQVTHLVEHPPHINGHQPHHQVDSRLSQPEHTQGPQLPALTGAVSQPKPPTPQPGESRSQDSNSLTVPESNGPANTPSPARTIPSVGALLNSNPPETGIDGRSDQSNSRSGSKSPNGNTRPLRDIPAGNLDSRAADQKALNKLNSMMLTTIR